MDRSKKFTTEKGDMQKVTREEALENMKRQQKEIEEYEKENGLDKLAEEIFGEGKNHPS